MDPIDLYGQKKKKEKKGNFLVNIVCNILLYFLCATKKQYTQKYQYKYNLLKIFTTKLLIKFSITYKEMASDTELNVTFRNRKIIIIL